MSKSVEIQVLEKIKQKERFFGTVFKITNTKAANKALERLVKSRS